MSDKKITTKFLKMLDIGIPMWYNTTRSNEEDKNMKRTNITYGTKITTEDGTQLTITATNGSIYWLTSDEGEERVWTIEEIGNAMHSACCFIDIIDFDWINSLMVTKNEDEHELELSDTQFSKTYPLNASGMISAYSDAIEVIDRWMAEEEDEDERDTLDSQKSDIEDAIRILRSVR